MKNFKNIVGLPIGLLFTIGMVMNLGSFSRNAFSPEGYDVPVGASMVSSSILSHGSSPESFPQYTSATYNYNNEYDEYTGGMINVPSGSMFLFQRGALKPSSDTPDGAPVTLDMFVEKVRNGMELRFTIGSPGCRFSPGAMVWLNWSALKALRVKLYRIDSSGKYVEQEPEYIDAKRRRLMIHVDRFSQYALCRGVY